MKTTAQFSEIKRNKNLQKAFTLIELIVVIAILGILAAAVLVAINPAQKIAQSKDAKVNSDIGQVSNALQAFFTDTGAVATSVYPSTANFTTDITTGGTLLTKGEISNVPTAPSGAYAYLACNSTSGANGNTACVTACADGGATCLYSSLSGPAYNQGANLFWCWRSNTGVTTAVVAASNCNP